MTQLTHLVEIAYHDEPCQPSAVWGHDIKGPYTHSYAADFALWLREQGVDAKAVAR